jgi:hypothetical protein
MRGCFNDAPFLVTNISASTLEAVQTPFPPDDVHPPRYSWADDEHSSGISSFDLCYKWALHPHQRIYANEAVTVTRSTGYGAFRRCIWSWAHLDVASEILHNRRRCLRFVVCGDGGRKQVDAGRKPKRVGGVRWRARPYEGSAGRKRLPRAAP